MATCPQCHTENDADFGLVQCSSCSASFFVQFDGTVEAAPSNAPSSTDAPTKIFNSKSELTSVLSENVLEDLQTPSVGEQPPPEPLYDFGLDSDSASDASSMADNGSPEVADQAGSAHEQNMSVSEGNVFAHDGATTHDPEGTKPQVKVPTAQNMREIAEYGNSEQSTAREGVYRFNLTVMGIDSAEIKTEVKDALSDARFLWDVEAMLNSMEDGILKIQDLSAVKSALVVQRLKILPVDIKWEQYAIHQSV